MASSELNSAPHPTPKVSVAITAFNSADWLPRALDSVLEQRTNFPIEIVVGDDCSQDATIRIAHSYRERYPNVVRVFERNNNVGIQRNYYETFENCRGKFIAWLDADDYWTDSEKLTVQVEIMESDPTITLCGHFIRVVSSDGKVKQAKSPSMPAGRYGVEEILHSCFIPSLSAVFRNGIHRQLPAWYFDLAPVTEWPIWVLAGLTGNIVLLDRVMADYMHTPGSSAWSKGPLFSNRIEAEFFEKIESILPSEWHRIARAEKGKRYESLAYFLRKQGEYTASREAAFKAFRSPATMDNCGSKTKALLAAVAREVEWRFRGGKNAD
jgi:glycosyltransferase involved in cell wall biosynthesis